MNIFHWFQKDFKMAELSQKEYQSTNKLLGKYT